MKQILLSLLLLAVLYPGFTQNLPSMKEKKHTTKSARLSNQTESELMQKHMQKNKVFYYGAITFKNSAQADSIMVNLAGEKGESWEPYMKEVPFYDGQSTLIAELEQHDFEENSYRPGLKYKASYDEEERITRFEVYFSNNGGWVPIYAEESVYNDVAEEVFHGRYHYNNLSNDWEIIDGFRAVDEHNENGAIVQRTWEYFNGDVWIAEYKEIYVLNEEDVTIEIVEYVFDEFAEEWEKDYRILVELCENNMWRTAYGYFWDWDFEEWVIHNKYVDFEWYDFARFMYTHVVLMLPDLNDDDHDDEEEKDHEDIEWVYAMRHNYEYNDHGLMTMMLFEQWGDLGRNEEWVPYIKAEMEYDHLLNTVSETMHLHDGNDWMLVFGVLFEMEYNADGSIKAFVFNELLSDLDGMKDVLVPVVQYVYYYEGGTTDAPFVELPGPADLKVYPNPASNYIHVELPEGNEYANVSIFGVDGRQMTAYSLSGFSASQPVHIDVSGLKSGLYFVRVQGNATQHTTRFMKK